jgi:hypothetical protein
MSEGFCVRPTFSMVEMTKIGAMNGTVLRRKANIFHLN